MISSVELAKKTFTGISLPEPYSRVLGKVPPNFSMAIWGPAGSGKSTVAVDLAFILAEELGKGIYCSSEEGAGPAMQSKIQRLKADHPSLFVKDFDGMEDLKSAIKYSSAKFCIFDSASMSHIKVSDMEMVHDFCKDHGVAFIYILHATKTGTYKGNSHLIHMPDTVLCVQDGIAKTTKNRFADTPQEFEVSFEAKERSNPDKQSQKKPTVDEGMLCGLEFIENPADVEGEFRENKGVSPDEIYQMITDRIISTIEKSGKLPWHKPWSGSGLGGGMTATNFVSKKPYRGINFFMLNTEWNGEELVMRKFDNPYFLTFNQVSRLDGKVKKGSKGNEVVYFTQLYSYEQSSPKLEFGTYSLGKFKNWLRDNASDIIGNTRTVWRDDLPLSIPNPNTLDELLEKAENWYVPILKYYNVFHADDIEGIDWGELPKNENVDRPEFQKIQVAEAIWENFRNAPDVRHQENRAFYVPSHDFINMPVPETFDNEQYYYSTLFHEGVHSTGHDSRLDRPMSTKFGDTEYNFEELVAELGATFLCSESGILFRTIDNSTAYLKGFGERLINQMEENNRFFFRASSRAQEAADYILNRNDDGVPAYLKDLQISDEEPVKEKSTQEESKPDQSVGITGKEVSVDFKADGSEKHTGEFKIIELADLRASHNKDCSVNSKHRISRGQPRDRSADNLCAQPKFIAKNLNPDSITRGNLAFQGAPVTLHDGMVIQGNGRSIALHIAYDEIEKAAKKYREFLIKNADEFGFKESDIKDFDKPVLVRALDVDDEEAVRLGNVVDTSQAKMNRIDQAKATIRGMEQSKLAAIGRIIGSSEGETIGAIIDDKGLQVFDQMKDLDRSGLVENSELTADGKEFLRSVLTGIIFDSDEHTTALRDFLDNPRTIQAGIERSFGTIIPLINQKGDIRSQLQEAISITAEVYRNDAFDSVEDVTSSQDMFSGQKEYSQQAQDLAKFLLSVKTQKAIRNAFRVYMDFIKGREDLFNPIEASSQKVAFKAAFVERKNPPEEIVKLYTPADFKKGDIIRDYYDNVKYSIEKKKGNTVHVKNTDSGKKETFKTSDKRFLPNREETPTLSLFDELRHNGPMSYMGITEKITIESGDSVKELEGNFPSFLSGDKLFIIPENRVEIVKNKVNDQQAVEDFEEFHNYNADEVDYQIDLPVEEKSVAVGTAQKIWYASDKVIQEGDKKGKVNHYVHDFDAGKRPAVVKGDVLVIGNIEWDARGLLN